MRRSKASSALTFVLQLLFLMIGLLPKFSHCEFIELNIMMEASSDEVHFVRGYLKAPASIDLSSVTFSTVDEPNFVYEDDEYNDMTDDNEDFDVDTSVPEETDLPMTIAPTPASIPVTSTPQTIDADPPSAAATSTVDGGGDEVSENANNGDSVDATANPQNDNSITDAPIEGGDSSPNDSPDNLPDGGEEGTGDISPSGEEGLNPTEVTENTLNEGEGEQEISPTDVPTGDGGDRRLNSKVSSSQSSRVLDDGAAKQVMDIILFVVPQDCKKDSWGTCDWAKLGVGLYDDMMVGGMSYCCSSDTAERGLCDKDDIGTFLVDHGVFQGVHREIAVPQSIGVEFMMENPKFDIESSGDYVLLISNCNDFGLEVLALGSMEWKSVKGYLPGDMFELMFFYAALAAFYFVLALWYYCGMRIYQDAAIPIQKYVLATMIIGFLEVLFRTTDFVIWNRDGFRSDGVMYTAMSMGVLKRGVSRCLGVMVAMGWGVVRDSLGSALGKIVCLGLLYSGLTLARDFFIVAAEDVQTISMSTKYNELLDFAWILTLLVILINLIFYFWIISSLNSTTEYLRNMNQTSKLKRHLRLRCLILASLVVDGVWLVVYIVQTVTVMLTQDLVWILEAIMHVNYLFILVGVSILWRPNSHAKDYAMQMEVPALGCEDNELELSCVVPSADDMDYDDGNDPDHRNGIQVDSAVLG